ncbi:MAG: hypothetical protein GEV03_24835 [Streptosporangiales bacterium]|nr:hypothetical protein [Streptosporangiales bacterium]
MLDIIWFLIVGFVIGAIGRFVVPGKNPMPWWLTLLLGVAGALAGGLVAGWIGLGAILKFVVSVAIAALLVLLVSSMRPGRAS